VQIAALALALSGLGNSFAAGPSEVSPDEALQRLRQGNARSVSGAVAGAKEPGHIATVINAIEPAVKQSRGQPGDPVKMPCAPKRSTSPSNCKKPHPSSPNGCNPGNSRSSPPNSNRQPPTANRLTVIFVPLANLKSPLTTDYRQLTTDWVFLALKRRADSCCPCGAKTILISPYLSADGVNPELAKIAYLALKG
jgi:hypothetical protein